tara:strand:+ start:719 stop:1999 length:1281 start_codon:yes stop_codon:yes gene_type:complete
MKFIIQMLFCIAYLLIHAHANSHENFTVSSGKYHTCALDDNGVTCWGRNNHNQTDVPTLNNPTAVDAGDWHSCAIHDDGLACWGRNSYGESTVPSGLINITEVSVGGYHTCVIHNGGSLQCWGLNSSGQTNVPSAISNYTSVASGMMHTCASHSGGVECWGYDDDEQSADQTYSPTFISAGFKNSCAVVGQKIQCWGWSGTTYGGTPALGRDMTNPVMVSTAYDHSCALDADGIDCWGDNDYGKAPGEITTLNDPQVVSSGNYHSCALDRDGVTCWGVGDVPEDDIYSLDHGQTNVPDTLSFTFPPPPQISDLADTIIYQNRWTVLEFINSGSGGISDCSISSGSIPEGLSLAVKSDSSTCHITGTPTQLGVATISVTALNDQGSDTANVTMDVRVYVQQVPHPLWLGGVLACVLMVVSVRELRKN